jgi:outer membrane protein TolC
MSSPFKFPFLRITSAFMLACVVLFGAAQAAEIPIGMEEAIQLALAKNFAIRIKAYGVPIAKAGVTEALGRFDVKLQGSYNNGREEDPLLKNLATGLRSPAEITDTDVTSLTLDGTLPTGATFSIGASTTKVNGTDTSFSDEYTNFAGVTLTQPLLKDAGLNPTFYQIRIAKTNKAVSEWEYKNAVIETVTNVIDTYSELHFAKARLRSAQRSYDLAVQLQSENERRFAVGERSEYDIISAKARVASRQDSIFAAERYVRVAENALKQLISDKRSPEILQSQLMVAPLDLETRPSIDAAKDFRSALEQRPDYCMALLAIKRGELDKRYYRNQRLPRVDVVGRYGYNGLASSYSDSRQDIRNQDYAAYAAGVVVSVPLGLVAERGRYRAAKLKLEQAQLSLQKLEQDIVVDVGNAAIQVESSLKRMEATRASREYNEQTLQAEIKRLRAGTGSTFSVLYQQEQLNSAEISEALAQADYRKALAEYDRQLGRTLTVHHIVLEGAPKH